MGIEVAMSAYTRALCEPCVMRLVSREGKIPPMWAGRVEWSAHYRWEWYVLYAHIVLCVCVWINVSRGVCRYSLAEHDLSSSFRSQQITGILHE